MRSLSWRFFSIVVLAAIIRFPYIGQLPPGSDQVFFSRLLSACAGVVSIGLYMAVLQQIVRQKQTSWWAGLVLTLMPWHIEQSRVYSPVLLGLTILLLGIYAYIRTGNRTSRGIIILLTMMGFFGIHPVYASIWEAMKRGTPMQIVDHIGYLTSGEFLFYKNETFWVGGMRTVGVFVPATVGIFLVGAYESSRRVRWSHMPWIGGYLVILITASMNPLFPEGRHYFLSTPYLALISGVGLEYMVGLCKYPSWCIRIGIFCFLSIIMYEYIWFSHLYISHYSHRIHEEVPYAARLF